MKLIEYLRSKGDADRGKLVGIFTDINEESSATLMKQVNDRIRKTKFRINHSQKREAALKEKLASVNDALFLLKQDGVNGEDIEILEGWRDELMKMLNKIDYKKEEDRHADLLSLKRRIKARAPIVSRILEEFASNGCPK